VPKRQQKSQDNQLIVKHDQEMRKRVRNWLPVGDISSTNKHPKSSRSFWIQPITRRFNKKQPI